MCPLTTSPSSKPLSMTTTNHIVLVADIHLLPEAKDQPLPILNQAFHTFLSTQLASGDQLYLMGDTFEVWVGDDISLDLYPQTIASLKALTHLGCQIFVQYGNRDFLMGSAFEKATGCQILLQPYEINLSNISLLLLHGDQLCTEDYEYQRMRRFVRNPLVQWLFLKLPKSKRQAIANKLRNKSKDSTRDKQAVTMDVTQAAVEDMMLNHSNCKSIVHGHTHKPEHHRFTAKGQPYERIVLGDWRIDQSEATTQKVVSQVIRCNHQTSAVQLETFTWQSTD